MFVTPSHLKSAWKQLPLSLIKADEVGVLVVQRRKKGEIICFTQMNIIKYNRCFVKMSDNI